MIGTVVGKYRIVGLLGRGAMGTVYRAVDESLYREVAVKVLNPDLVDTPIMTHFRSEATVLARLNHPVIATLYELFTTPENDTLIVMELVPGETLERICTRSGPMAPAHAVFIVDRVLSALDHAHRVGVVHCDIKPANVMVTAQGDVKIMDFGTARVPGKRQQTADKFMMGTPAYMPPEQVTGGVVDARSDLYAVGVVLYRMLAGTPPFVADSLVAVMQKQIAEEAAPLSAHRQGLPEWCEAIVRRAMAKAAADRFQNAAEFSAALRAAGAVMRQPVGVAHPDLITIAADVERRTDMSADQTLPVPQKPPTARDSTLAGSTVALRTPAPPAGRSARTEWRPFAVPFAIVGVAVLAVWQFAGGGSLQTSGGPRLFERSTVPPVQTSTPAGARRTPIIHAAPKSDPPATAAANSSASLPPAVPTPSTPSTLGATTTPAPMRASAPPPSGPAANRPDAKTAAPALAFEARYLAAVDGGPRERDCRVLLADGRINVEDTGTATLLSTLAYEDVLSISYSRGRDPLWNAPGGPQPVAKTGGGPFGILRGTRQWIALRTTNAKNRFVVLRMGNDVQAKRAITALEERTGRRAQTIGGGGDTK